jgi:hypothetical protein
MPQENHQPKSDDIGTLPLLLQIRDELAEHRHEFADLKKNLMTGFPKNDFGSPDFEQHRRDHQEISAERKRLDDYKVDFTKKLISWGGIGLITILLTGLLQYFKA